MTFLFHLLIISIAISLETTLSDDSVKHCHKRDGNVVCDKNNNKNDGESLKPSTSTSDKSNGVLENKYASFKGHLKPFGESGSQTPVKEIIGFPKTNFFLDYVLPSIPVLMKGAATRSPSFHKLQSDDYLLRLSTLDENMAVKVEVEYGKKENRDSGGKIMAFSDFLKVYNTSDVYMVQDVLPFMKPILMMPCPLQCPHLDPIPTKNVMWFSSGGTNSVVHNDGEENVNCLYRGNKTLTFLDPTTISVGTVLEIVYGSFSMLDVDKVDLNKYPTLRGAKFITATMQPGDCLFIPYRWLHQVRSYGNNLAVNVWFSHKLTTDLLRKGHCIGYDHDISCDPTFTLGRVSHPHLSETDYSGAYSMDTLKLFFEYSSIRGKASVSPENPPLTKAEEKVNLTVFLDEMLKLGLDPFSEMFGWKSGTEDLKTIVNTFLQIMMELDVNSDGILTSSEFDDGFSYVRTFVDMASSGQNLTSIFDGEESDDGGSVK